MINLSLFVRSVGPFGYLIATAGQVVEGGGGQNTHNFREKNQFSWADQRKRKRGFIVLLTKLVVALHDERILFSDVSKFLPTEFKTNVVLSRPNGVRLGLGLA